MKTRYDPEIDALTIRLADVPIQESQEVAPNIILDFDAEGRVVGLEILNASKNAARGAIPLAAE